MIFKSPAAERLHNALRRLPGIGNRSAERMALYLLSAPEDEALALSEAVREARQRIRRCSQCCTLTEEDPCPVCSDPKRDQGLVCVVEQPSAMLAIEKGGTFRGAYHVLHGTLSPLDGIGPGQLTIEALMRRVETGAIREVILATNTTSEGEATALYLTRKLQPRGIDVSRIAHGVPMGGGLEYADDVTLAHALQGRTRL